MALLDNGLNTIEVGARLWSSIINAAISLLRDYSITFYISGSLTNSTTYITGIYFPSGKVVINQVAINARYASPTISGVNIRVSNSTESSYIDVTMTANTANKTQTGTCTIAAGDYLKISCINADQLADLNVTITYRGSV